MGAKSSLEILTEFLSKHKIKADPKKHLKKYIVDSDRTIQLQDDIVDRIIADGYDVTSEKVAEIDALLQKKIEFYLGRVQKEQLKTYLAYEDPDDLQQLIKLSGDSFTAEGKKIYKEEVLPKEKITEAVEKFLSKLKEAIKDKNNERVQDYLTFIYSRLLAKNEHRKLSLKQLFDNNAQKYDLTKSQQKSLKTFCKSKKLEQRFKVINRYNTKYLKLLEQDDKKEERRGGSFSMGD